MFSRLILREVLPKVQWTLSKRHVVSSSYWLKTEWDNLLDNYSQTSRTKHLPASVTMALNDTHGYAITLIHQAKDGKPIWPVEIDSLVTAVACDSTKTDLTGILNALNKFRIGPLSPHAFPSTSYSILRHMINIDASADSILAVLKDKLKYGVFVDGHSAVLLISHFLNNGQLGAACQVAFDVMLQEQLDHSTTRLLCIDALLKFIEASIEVEDVSSSDENAFSSSLPDKPAGFDDEEDSYIFNDYVKLPYFDDHFALTEIKLLVGKTLFECGREHQPKRANAVKRLILPDFKTLAIIQTLQAFTKRNNSSGFERIPTLFSQFIPTAKVIENMKLDSLGRSFPVVGDSVLAVNLQLAGLAMWEKFNEFEQLLQETMGDQLLVFPETLDIAIKSVQTAISSEQVEEFWDEDRMKQHIDFKQLESKVSSQEKQRLVAHIENIQKKLEMPSEGAPNLFVYGRKHVSEQVATCQQHDCKFWSKLFKLWQENRHCFGYVKDYFDLIEKKRLEMDESLSQAKANLELSNFFRDYDNISRYMGRRRKGRRTSQSKDDPFRNLALVYGASGYTHVADVYAEYAGVELVSQSHEPYKARRVDKAYASTRL